MTERLPTPNDKDFDLLRASNRGNFVRLGVKVSYALIALILIALGASYALRITSGDTLPEASVMRKHLFVLQESWSDSLLTAWDDYRGWINRHGTASEMSFFDHASSMIIESALNSNAASIPAEEQGTFSKIYLGFHAGMVRLLFLLVASARVWMVVLCFACFSGLVSYKPYAGEDALGQMSNGRLFYSGVRAGLDKLSSNGAPDVQIRGFACPQMASQTEAHGSEIWATLKRFNACNSTNEALTRAIVKNGSTCAYVAIPEEESDLQRAFSGSTLLSNTPHLLEVALRLHARYISGDTITQAAEPRSDESRNQLNAELYAARLSVALDQVLTPTMRGEIAALPATEIATAILSMESGKILAHSFEGGRWNRKSNFPHLSARAVLHSMIEYPKDYSFESRNRIRRALIYAARRSAFAPVRMPIDMSDDSWVLRQWMEVLLACPHELPAVAHEVELVGIVRESHAAWCKEFFDNGEILAPEISAECFATPTNLLVLPVPRITKLLRKVVSPQVIDRMHTLLAAVGAEQRRRSAKSQENDSGPTEQLSFDRVVPRPAQSEIEALARLHGMAPSELSDWLALRVILSSYGWLASRVGDYSVPDTSIIFAVFKAEKVTTGVNQLGLFGRPGMVPLRGSKLTEEWGRSWNSRFTAVRKVTMAETQEDYEKLLQGVEDVSPPDDEGALAVSPIVS